MLHIGILPLVVEIPLVVSARAVPYMKKGCKVTHYSIIMVLIRRLPFRIILSIKGVVEIYECYGQPIHSNKHGISVH